MSNEVTAFTQGIVMPLICGLILWYFNLQSKKKEKEQEKRDNSVDSKLELLTIEMREVRQDFQSFQLSVAKEFVTRPELDSSKKENTDAHKNIWDELKESAERIVDVESRLTRIETKCEKEHE